MKLCSFIRLCVVGMFVWTFSVLTDPRIALANESPFSSLEVFTKVLHLIRTSYVEEVTTEKLIQGALKGMLAALDPHSQYLPPEQYKEMQVDTAGKFGGLGVEVSIQDGVPVVITPIEDTPAYKAGIQPGDRIVSIEDKARKLKKEGRNVTMSDIVGIMRGEKGTTVTLTVSRKGLERDLIFDIQRDIIRVSAVKSGLMDTGFAWIRITNFQLGAGNEVKAQLDKLTKLNRAPLQGAVLDLRSNPGGLLDEAVSVSSVFIEKVPVVSTVGRDKEKKEVEFARLSAPYKNLKLIVLVNEASASASEIVAGALQDHQRALIVGKQTFGKGSVQSVIDLENKSGLKLTIARYYTPNGRSIQSKGITPDIEIDRIDMAALEKSKKSKVLRESDLENHMTGEGESKSVVSNIEKDLRPVKEKNGKFSRLDDPRELLKTDFQLSQALGLLKATNLMNKKTEDPIASSPLSDEKRSGASVEPN